MNHREERYILDSLDEIRAEVHDCKVMLSQLCSVVNHWVANRGREEDDDFGRNVLANIVSNMVGGMGLC